MHSSDTLPDARIAGSARGLLGGWFRSFGALRRRRRATVRLTALSDHMLRDIGLTPDGAPNRVREGLRQR